MLNSGTCRGNDILRIRELIDEYGPMEVGDIAKKMRRSVRYVVSLVKEDDSENRDLHFTREPKLKREWLVSR